MWPRWVLTCSLALAFLAFAFEALSGEPQKKASSPAPAPAAPELPSFTPERETAALDFVAKHHPELGDVLARLKTLNRDQYQQAIRGLFQEADKLAMFKEKDAGLYELSLESWKVKSRIEVLAAQLACAKEKNTKLEEELKTLLYRQVDLQREIVEYNRERTLAALKGMEANIKWLRENRDELVEKRLRGLSRSSKTGAAPAESATPKKPESPQPNRN